MSVLLEEPKRSEEFDLEEIVENIIRVYPTKVARKRRRHILARDPSVPQEIEANVRTVPGIITQRGCCYAGCKGVVIGPIVDMVHIVHGPIGCSFYAWMTRRNQGVPREDGHYFLEYCFSTDMQEENIIFGGEKKLRAAIKEAYEIFHPKAISIHATCPVGLIGDDIHAVAKEMSQELGIDIVAFSCEGYRGVSQSAGHHIANNGLFEHIVGQDDVELEGFTVNCLGEYNIGGDAWEIERILDRCGIKVASTFSGNGSYDEFRRAHMADVNLVQCHRSINYMAEMMETKFGIPWIKVNFIGVKATSKSLRKLAEFFEDDALLKRIEEVIRDEEEKAEEQIAPYRKRLEGKTAFLFVGGSRAHHYQDLFSDLGMKTIVAGYEFAHRDDYEGRDILPKIKVDADSRNIPELEVEPDPERFRPRKDPETLERLRQMGIVDTYEGMMRDMGPGTLIVDDISHFELEYLMETLKPDIVCSGIKDKYVIQKMGVPSKQLHSYDYSGPFAGYRGAVNFAKEIDMLINNPAWSFARPPWEKAPLIKGAVITE